MIFTIHFGVPLFWETPILGTIGKFVLNQWNVPFRGKKHDFVVKFVGNHCLNLSWKKEDVQSAK